MPYLITAPHIKVHEIFHIGCYNSTFTDSILIPLMEIGNVNCVILALSVTGINWATVTLVILMLH